MPPVLQAIVAGVCIGMVAVSGIRHRNTLAAIGWGAAALQAAALLLHMAD